MRKPKIACLTALIVLLAGCGAPEDESGAFTDGLGRTVHPPDPAQRVVTLAPNLTEIIFAVGASDVLVAVSSADDFPPEVESIRKISALPVDFEALLELEADLVLANAQVNSTRDADVFEAMGIPVYYFDFATVDDTMEAIRTAGRLTGRSGEADRVADSLETRLRAITPDPRVGRPSPTVLFLVSPEILYSFGSGSYVNEMIHAAGGISATASIPQLAPVLSQEFVLEVDPDIILGAGDDFTTEGVLEAQPGWHHLRAVANQHVFSIDPDLMYRPGPRLVEGVEAIQDVLEQAGYLDE